MLRRTKLMTSIIVSLIVLAMSIGLLVFFIIQKNNNNDTPEQNGGSVQDSINATPFKDYSAIEKKVFSDAIIEGLSLSTRFEVLQLENEWLVEFSTKTIDNISQAFEDAEIDIQVYKAVAEYVLEAAKIATGLDFNLKDLIVDDQNISLDEVLNVILKVENINIIYRLFTDFYSTGMSSDDIAEVLYYFLQYETSTIDYYKYDFIGGLENMEPETADEQAKLAAFQVLAINTINALVDSATAIEKEDFVGTVSPSIDKLYVILGMYKDYNLYNLVEIAYKIKNGEVTPEEVAIIAGNIKEQLLGLVNPETGKFFEITGETYNAIYSFATKVPTFTYLLSLIIPIDLTLPLPEMSDSFLEAETFINRLVTGLINAVGKITNEKNLLVIDEDEVVIDRISMAEAICQNLKEIITDDGVKINTDAIIIMSKIIGGIFEEDAISIDYFNDYMTQNVTMISDTLQSTDWGDLIEIYLPLLGVAVGEEFAEGLINGSISVMNAITNYNGLFTNIIRIFISFSHFDLGTHESKLLDITPSYVLIEDLINNFFTSVFTGKSFTIIELLVIVIVIVALPAIIPLLPIILVGWGAVMMYIVAAIIVLIVARISSGSGISEDSPFFWPMKLITVFMRGATRVVESLYYFVEKLFLNEYEVPYGDGKTGFDQFYDIWDNVF